MRGWWRGLAAAAAIGGAAALGAGTALAMGSISAPDPAPAASAADNYAQAVKLVAAKQYDKAVVKLQDVVRDQPDHADALNYLGYSYRKLGRFDRAVRYYKQALEIDPGHRGANEYLGEAYLELNNLAGAEERLEKLRALCGESCEEYRELARAVAAFKAGKPVQQSSRRW